MNRLVGGGGLPPGGQTGRSGPRRGGPRGRVRPDRAPAGGRAAREAGPFFADPPEERRVPLRWSRNWTARDDPDAEGRGGRACPAGGDKARRRADGGLEDHSHGEPHCALSGERDAPPRRGARRRGGEAVLRDDGGRGGRSPPRVSLAEGRPGGPPALRVRRDADRVAPRESPPGPPAPPT